MESEDDAERFLQREKQRALEELFLRDSETKYRFCIACMHMMCERDCPWHKCQVRTVTPNSYRKMRNILNYCRGKYRTVVRMTIWFLKGILGVDVTRLICELLRESRDDICLWYQFPPKRIKIKPKTRKTLKAQFRLQLKDKFYINT